MWVKPWSVPCPSRMAVNGWQVRSNRATHMGSSSAMNGERTRASPGATMGASFSGDKASWNSNIWGNTNLGNGFADGSAEAAAVRGRFFPCVSTLPAPHPSRPPSTGSGSNALQLTCEWLRERIRRQVGILILGPGCVEWPSQPSLEHGEPDDHVPSPKPWQRSKCSRFIRIE
jgi:hypothetical protein